MDVTCFYCENCGLEDYDIYVPYVRTVANGDVCECPICKSEVMNFETEEDK